MSLIDVQAVTKVYGGGFLKRTPATAALRNFSLTIPADEPRIIALAGESGSGKTTAAQLILGFVRPTDGRILYRGADVGAMRRRQRTDFRREVQAITQDPYAAFNPFYRVQHVFDVAVRNFHIEDGRRQVDEALEFVGLDPRQTLSKFPHQLSGGQRQRVMVARAFLLKPRLIVADEPVSMVDASIRSAILELMLRLKTELGVSFLYITHDLSTAYQIADDIVVLFRGEAVERGGAREVIDSPQHEYTQLLISSIPVPDPDTKWEGRLTIPASIPKVI